MAKPTPTEHQKNILKKANAYAMCLQSAKIGLKGACEEMNDELYDFLLPVITAVPLPAPEIAEILFVHIQYLNAFLDAYKENPELFNMSREERSSWFLNKGEQLIKESFQTEVNNSKKNQS